MPSWQAGRGDVSERVGNKWLSNLGVQLDNFRAKAVSVRYGQADLWPRQPRQGKPAGHADYSCARTAHSTREVRAYPDMLEAAHGPSRWYSLRQSKLCPELG